MVNIRPFRPGHVLLCSKRNVHFLKELNEMETLDFWLTAREVATVLE